MGKRIEIGDTFTVRRGGRVDMFRRETDDPAPRFECERIRVTHLSCSDDAKLRPYTFGTEPEWFKCRGLVVGSKRSRIRGVRVSVVIIDDPMMKEIKRGR